MNYSLLAGVFLEGLLSFLSPCVLPLLPLYLSYLAGDGKKTNEEGNVWYDPVKTSVSALFFISGIALTFVLLGFSIEFISDYIGSYSEVISLVGGTVLIFFGLHQTGLIHIDILEKEFKIKADLHLEKMNYLKAFLLGFVFSLGWSPCIGPMLANAILLAASSSEGYLYILFYALGLIIPFLAAGVFTSAFLNWLKEKKNIFRKVLILSGIVMICFGSYMIYRASRTIVALKNIEPVSVNDENESTDDIEAYLTSYEFKDQDGNTVRLSDYQGKYLFLNFSATWCTYCKEEIPIYKEFSENEDVICLYVMSPLNEDSDTAIETYLKENKIVLPTIIDEDGILFYYLRITGYPTVYVLDPDTRFSVYAAGALSMDGFSSLLDYAKEHYEK
ncbi:MAG: redoxin domain-containing protein [Erysipelotrichaceae bacterium]|nr:redoxin domain-containing protein [Erysipelotrichaceae bacterium]